MVDILKQRKLEVNLIAKEIYNDHRYFIWHNALAPNAGSTLARYQILDTDGNWRNDMMEKVFDTKTEALKFLKDKNLEHADRIFEAIEIEDEAYDY